MNKSTNEKPYIKEWLNPQEVKEEFGIALNTQAKYRMDRRIPFSKINGKFIRYNRYKLYEWFESYSVEVRE